jgi:hypothetical protein
VATGGPGCGAGQQRLEGAGAGPVARPGVGGQILVARPGEGAKPSTTATSGLADHLVHNRGRSLAFDDITHEVALLMKDHPNAKLFITSHSIGGALATLYPLMLFFTKQVEMTSKIGAVYTQDQRR